MKESFVLVISLILCILLVIAIFLIINLGEIKRYNEDWILGKTKEQVIEKYGELNRVPNFIASLNQSAGYTICDN